MVPNACPSFGCVFEIDGENFLCYTKLSWLLAMQIQKVIGIMYQVGGLKEVLSEEGERGGFTGGQ